RAVEGQQTVNVILDDGQPVPCRQRQQFAPPFQRRADSCRIVEARDGVEEARLLLNNRALQSLQLHAIGIERHTYRLDAVHLQNVQQPQVSRLLDGHSVAG